MTSIPAPARNRLYVLVEKPWLLPAYRVFYGVSLTLLGALLGRAEVDVPLVVALLIVLAILFFLIEVAFSKTIGEVEESAKSEAMAAAKSHIDSTNQAREQAVSDLELSDSAKEFLSKAAYTTACRIDVLIRDVQAGGSIGLVDSKEAIDEGLRSMCRALRYDLGRRMGASSSELMFRSTYMQVQEVNGSKRLAYFAWYTPDGYPPRSYTEGVTLELGDGCAGGAWKSQKPVIESEFESGQGWVDNYAGQGEKYKSMICVPVFREKGGVKQEVAGVITVDTNVPGYFGKGGDRESEQRFGKALKPYVEYVALVSAGSDLAEVLNKRYRAVRS